MTQASEQIARQYAAGAINKQAWGTAMYNVLVEGLLGGGVIDDTPKLQALINKAIAEGRKAIFFPHGINGQYYVTALTNADQVIFFGDNAKFVGGYTGKINQIGFAPSAAGMWLNVQDYNAKGEGLANDDTQAFIDALTALVAAGGGKLVIPATSSFYNVTNSIAVTLPDGVFIEVEGIGKPEIRLTANSPAGSSVTLFNFLATNNATPINGVNIHGIRLNGIGVPEQWDATVPANSHYVTALNAEVGGVIIRDCEIVNCYGMGIRIVRYNHVIISNCKTDHVGGKWYQSDANDAFGDSIYLAYAQSQKAVASISDCSLIGYPADRPRLSRIGITVEYGGSVVYVNNCYMEGYQRNFHIEAADLTEIDINNITVERFAVGLYLYGGAKHITVSNSKFRNQIVGGWASSGLIGTGSITRIPDFIRITNCLFEIGADCSSRIEAPTTFQNCKFVRVGGRWTVEYAQIQSMDGCKIDGECFSFFDPAIESISNTVIKGQISAGAALAPVEVLGGYIRKFSNCRLEDAVILTESGDDFNFEFDSCRFVRTGTTALKARTGGTFNGFTRPYATNIIIRDCIRQATTDFPFVDPAYGTPRLTGTNNSIIAGVWA